MKFLKKKLNSGNFGGVAGANLQNIQKLNIANQLVSMIDFASPLENVYSKKEKDDAFLNISAFQVMIFSEKVKNEDKKEIINDIFNWILF